MQSNRDPDCDEYPCETCGASDLSTHDHDCPYREVVYDFAGPGEPKGAAGPWSNGRIKAWAVITATEICERMNESRFFALSERMAENLAVCAIPVLEERLRVAFAQLPQPAPCPTPTPGEVAPDLHDALLEVERWDWKDGVSYCTVCGNDMRKPHADDCAHTVLRRALAGQQAGWNFDTAAAPLDTPVLLLMECSYRPCLDKDPTYGHDVGYRTDHHGGGWVRARAGTPIAWMPLPEIVRPAPPAERSGG